MGRSPTIGILARIFDPLGDPGKLKSWLTWNNVIWGSFPLLTTLSARENSEAVTIFLETWISQTNAQFSAWKLRWHSSFSLIEIEFIIPNSQLFWSFVDGLLRTRKGASWGTKWVKYRGKMTLLLPSFFAIYLRRLEQSRTSEPHSRHYPPVN